jgi:hypothetical protein
LLLSGLSAVLISNIFIRFILPSSISKEQNKMNNKRSNKIKTPKKEEKNAVHHQISNLLSPYKSSRTNTTLLLVTALKEYRSTVGNLERKIQELELENKSLRRELLCCRNPEDRLIRNPQEGKCHDSLSVGALQPEDASLVRVRVSGDTTCMQRQVLTSLMDYLNSDTKGDLEMTKLRASNALEALKDSMTDIHDETSDKVYFSPVKDSMNESEENQKVPSYTAITMDFLQKMIVHVGDAIDLDSKLSIPTNESENDIELQHQSTVFIQNDALIQALTLLINERDTFIEELTSLYDAERRHNSLMHSEQVSNTV